MELRYIEERGASITTTPAVATGLWKTDEDGYRLVADLPEWSRPGHGYCVDSPLRSFIIDREDSGVFHELQLRDVAHLPKPRY